MRNTGLTLGVLSEAACFRALLGRMENPASIGSGGPGGESSEKEFRLCFELCSAALELEPVEDVMASSEPPTSSGGGAGGADGGMMGISAAERRRRLLIGQRMPHVPRSVLLALVHVTTQALEPVAAVAKREAAEDPAGWQPVADGVYGDDEDDEEDEVGGAIATLCGGLIRKAAAGLAPHAAVASAATQPLMDPSSAAGGMASPAVSDEQLSAALLALLHKLVQCSAHRRRSVCEVLLATDCWPATLKAAEFWPQRNMRDSLLSSLAAALCDRAAFFSDHTLHDLAPADFDEYLEFRDSYLAEPLAQIARHEPAALATEAVRLMTLPTGAPAESPPWQKREAALFAASASVDVLVSRVLPIPHIPQPGVPPPPPPPPSPLGAVLPPLLQAALVPPASLRTCASEPWCGDRLLLRTRCRLIGTLAPWLAGPGLEHMDTALGGVLSCLSHPQPLAAEAAVVCLAQISVRCAEELALSTERLHASFAALAASTPGLTPEYRCNLVAAVARFAVAAPEAARQPLVEALMGPLISALQQGVAAIEAAAGGSVDVQAHALAQQLDEAAAAIKSLRSLGKPALAALLSHLWPAWVAAANACRLAPAVLLGPLAAVGRVGVCGAGTEGQALLPQTVQALTSAFGASPAAGAPLFDLADAVFEVFCDAPGMESSFASLLDQLASNTLPLLTSPTESDDRLEIAASLLAHADKIARLLPTAVAHAASLPSLVGLATTLLSACRKEGPQGVEPAIEFLGAVAVQARTHGTGGADPSAEQVRSRLEAALSGAAGDALVRACLVGLSDTLPASAIPYTASILAPLMHTQSWRASANGATTSNLHAWTHAALTALPVTDGVPDSRTCETLLSVLTSMPDPLTGGRSFNLGLLEALRKALGEFAAICRRTQNAAAFELAAYDWTALRS